MIDPKELMIGNHLYWDYDKKEVEVISVNSTYLWVKMRGGKNEVAYYKHLSPIPLTPEILERYGFEKALNDDDIYYTEKDIFNGLFSNSWNHYDINKKAFMTGYFSDELKCEHLHHLQNIIQNLTGKPLIK